MRELRILQGAARTILRYRLRTFFMMLGAFVGVIALTVTVAFGRGTRDDVLERMNRMLGASSILMRAGGGVGRAGPHGTGVTGSLKLHDVQALPAAVPAVLLADPHIMTGGRDVVFEGRTARVGLVAHSENYEAVWNRRATRGTHFNTRHVSSAARVALVGETVVRDLFDGADPIGRQIRIGGLPFDVIGVLESVGVDPHGIDRDNEIIIPITTMMRRVLNVDYVLGAKLAVDPGADLETTVQAVRTVLRERHGLGPDDPDDFALFTAQQAQRMIRSASRIFTLFLPLAAGLSILLGGLVVANLMLSSVHERRAEIGLRKATGARPRDIRLQFVAESAAVTTLGGLAAVVVAFVALQFVVLHGMARVAMPWSAAMLGIVLATTVGVIAGAWPAARAAALDAAQTLR